MNELQCRFLLLMTVAICRGQGSSGELQVHNESSLVIYKTNSHGTPPTSYLCSLDPEGSLKILLAALYTPCSNNV